MQELGKKESLTEHQLALSVQMLQWARASPLSGGRLSSFGSLKDSQGESLLLLKHPEWLAQNFICLESWQSFPKAEGFCCNFCDLWARTPGECAACQVGKLH